MTDPQPVTVLDRLTAAGLSRDRIDEHLRAGRIQVDGETIEDLGSAAAPPARIVIAGD